MKVLVTGGTGVVGRAAVSALVDEGHAVRLLSRNARRDAKQWGARVDPWPGDVARDMGLEGSAEGCDVVLHAIGLIAPTEHATLDTVNVDGTRRMLDEARGAGKPKFIFVSSLGAERGTSDYHRSKRAAEALVREYEGDWVIVRPGNVYGPGDDQISLLLRMVRTLPVIPVIGGGDTLFQPVYAGDLGRALVQVVERDDLSRRSLDIAGSENTSQNDLLDRFARITNREPARVGIPEFLASIGIRIAETTGVDVPFSEAQLTMLRDGNRILADKLNALTDVLGVVPTPLDEGLRILADALPEVLPSEGIGTLKRKRFWADITGCAHTPESLFAMVCDRFGDLTPFTMDVNAEPDTPKALDAGATLTMALPLRGHVQVRVEEITDRRVTLCTLAGHPLAGAVRLLSEERGDRIRFEIQVYDRPATLVDLLVMRPLGEALQSNAWEQVVTAVVEASGGRAADGVEHDEAALDDEQAERVDEWLAELVMRQRRDGHEEGIQNRGTSEAEPPSPAA